MKTQRTFNRRRHERFCLAPMYTSVTARTGREGDQCELTGHAYDISESGASNWTTILRPAKRWNCTFASRLMMSTFATANVVRLFDHDDDPGPWCMGVEFTDFVSDVDRQRLLTWLGRKQLLRAA